MSEMTKHADVETSSSDYATRFSGKVGNWLLSVQTSVLLQLLQSLNKDSLTILDVGGGHGQIVRAFHDLGLLRKYKVTVLGSDSSCDGQLKDLISQNCCNFQVGDLVELPFADRSFDVVTSFRFVPHCPQWPKLIASMCRVASNAVIIDYPTSQSINALTPLLFHWKKKLEGNTRTYDLFSHREIADNFKTHKFSRMHRIGEFFWPMVIHRKLKLPILSASLEFFPKLLGLTNLLGSPSVLCARRDKE